MKTKTTKAKTNKIILRVFSAVYILLCLILLVYSVTGMVSWKLQKDAYISKPIEQSGVFYDADFESDLSQDEEYQQKMLYITYSDSTGAVRETITDENYELHDKNLVFFAKYFQMLRNGDYENFDTLFTNSYFDVNEHTDLSFGFTKQRIYDIVINYASAYEQGAKTFTTYEVVYKIMKNDGTFRNDIASDQSRPQYITLVSSDDGTFISRIAYSYNPTFNYSVKAIETEIYAAIFAVSGIILFFAILIVLKIKRKKRRLSYE